MTVTNIREDFTPMIGFQAFLYLYRNRVVQSFHNVQVSFFQYVFRSCDSSMIIKPEMGLHEARYLQLERTNRQALTLWLCWELFSELAANLSFQGIRHFQVAS